MVLRDRLPRGDQGELLKAAGFVHGTQVAPIGAGPNHSQGHFMQPNAPPVVDCAASVEVKTIDGEDARDPFVIASLSPALAIEDTSLGSLRRRLPDASRTATLLAVARAAKGGGARAIETIVGYFQLALPAPASVPGRAAVSTIPGLRGGLQQALEMGRERVKRTADEPSLAEVDLAVAYIAFPVLYVASAGHVGCQLLRGGQLMSLAPLEPANEARASSRAQLRILLDHALGHATARATSVRRFALRRGDRLVLSTDGVGRSELAPSVAAILGDAVDARAAARAIGALVGPTAGPPQATVLVARVA